MIYLLRYTSFKTYGSGGRLEIVATNVANFLEKMDGGQAPAAA
jgi:hypothetical protein